MSSRFAFIRNLSREQRRLWAIGAGVFAVGTSFKFAYFQFSRGLMVEDMDARHLRAKAHLDESRDFAQWAEKDRNKRAPELTDAQRRQLQQYLQLMAEHNREVHPVPPTLRTNSVAKNNID
mmetsp:Transcript_7462/g.15579  ORF Transcript_7462/g.15579 Transcript_7462/m.15579 type:complete len:121 (+) Transcript_7462:176-538(+)